MITFNPDLKIFQSSVLAAANYFSGFSTTAQGNSLVLENLTKFFALNKIDYQKIIVPEQIHSINVTLIEASENAREIENKPDTDGLITNLKKVVLTVRNADCVPVIYLDSYSDSIGISHQGWRGSLKNMSRKMITQLINQGSKPENIKCAIGPAIGACCYEVDDDHYFEFLDQYENYASKIFFKRKSKWHINLAYLNYLQLRAIGVRHQNIDFFPFCTKCDQQRLYSRRRSQSKIFPELFNFIIKV